MTGSVPRRTLLALSAGAAAATLLPSAASASPIASGCLVDPRLGGPVDRAYQYLDTVMDAYAGGDQFRLLQSYNNESGLLTTAFVYDNALAAIAYLSRPTREHVRRACLIGDALLWIQANDESFHDGRVRQAYAAGPMLFYGWFPEFKGLIRDDGKAAFLWPFGFSGTSVGDAAWVGLALAKIHAHTRQRKYLDGAVAIAKWITDQNQSPYRLGGYLGGVQANGTTRQTWASTEHNIDCHALFQMLARLTRDRIWAGKAQVAKDFLRAMWNQADGYFWTGTQEAAPDEINKAILPEDVNSWSYLALQENRYARALDWNLAHLSNTDSGADSELPAGASISGVTFSDQSKALTGTVPNGTRPNDRNAVWLEGNGHMAAALLARGDRRRAVELLLETVKAQDTLGGGQTVGLTSDPNGGRLFDPGEGGTWTGTPLPARSGIVSASSQFDTGFGFGYFQRQHVGATAWFLMAAQAANPYVL